MRRVYLCVSTSTRRCGWIGRGLLPLILRAALGVFTQVREQSEGPLYQYQGCLCANVESVFTGGPLI